MNTRNLRLEDRTLRFSQEMLKFCKNEPINNINRPIIDQLVRSATAIGANYAEARNAASKMDFRNKVYTAKKEAAETKYWLILMKDITTDKEMCSELSKECHYILMTLQKAVNTLNSTKRPPVTG